jgi:hypothetical protein
MADALLSAFLGVLFDRLASPELLNFARQEGLEKKLKKWSKMLPRIEAVLDETWLTMRMTYSMSLPRKLCDRN